jgi:hypothetical protein
VSGGHEVKKIKRRERRMSDEMEEGKGEGKVKLSLCLAN